MNRWKNRQTEGEREKGKENGKGGREESGRELMDQWMNGWGGQMDERDGYLTNGYLDE